MENPTIEKLNKFFVHGSPIQYKKGEIIIRAEDVPAGVFYITKGFVRFYSLDEDGKELTLNIFKPGSYFPMTWALGDMENLYFYEAMAPTELWKSPKKEVLEFIKSEPEVLFELTRRLMVGLGGLVIRMEYLLRGNAYQKTCSVLELSARRFGKSGKNDEIIIDFPLTHQEIANLAGLTRETASIELKKLENSGLVSRKKRTWIIKDFKKLKSEATLYLDGEPLPYSF